MAKKIIYQTLEDRGNPDVVERDGPFRCNRNNAWLGDGFYFWDGYIKNAHWWGDTCKYPNGYMICEAVYDFDEVNCFDLVNNENHLTLLSNAIDAMTLKGLFNNKTTVARIIQFVKEELKIFHYAATRVYGVNSKADNSMFSARAIFDVRRPYQYLDLLPAIQICFYKRTSLNLRNYTIIYPAEYNENYAV